MTLVDKFVTHVISESSFEEMDRIYLTNRILARVGDGVLEVETDLDKVIDLKDQLVEEAVRLETIEDSQTAREILGAELMDLVTPCPSQVNRDFWSTYAQSPEQAIADFTNSVRKMTTSNSRPLLKISLIVFHLIMENLKLPSISLSLKRIPKRLRQPSWCKLAIIPSVSFV